MPITTNPDENVVCILQDVYLFMTVRHEMILKVIGLLEEGTAMMTLEGSLTAVNQRMLLDISRARTNVRTVGTTISSLKAIGE